LLALSDPEVQVLVGEFSEGHSPCSHSALTPSLPYGNSCHAPHGQHFEKLCRKLAKNLQKRKNLSMAKDMGLQKYTENKKDYTFSLPGACLLWVIYAQEGLAILLFKENSTLIYTN